MLRTDWEGGSSVKIYNFTPNYSLDVNPLPSPHPQNWTSYVELLPPPPESDLLMENLFNFHNSPQR